MPKNRPTTTIKLVAIETKECKGLVVDALEADWLDDGGRSGVFLSATAY
jgi:hypothetical protein